MPKPPAISDAEWEVMTVLWEQSPLTANEVVDRLKGRKAWSPATIKTLLNRLLKKRAIGFSAQANRYLYTPRVGRDACVRDQSRSFVERVFGGAMGPMLAQFVRQANLSEQEIEQLREALNENRTNEGSEPCPGKSIASGG